MMKPIQILDHAAQMPLGAASRLDRQRIIDALAPALFLKRLQQQLLIGCRLRETLDNMGPDKERMLLPVPARPESAAWFGAPAGPARVSRGRRAVRILELLDFLEQVMELAPETFHGLNQVRQPALTGLSFHDDALLGFVP